MAGYLGAVTVGMDVTSVDVEGDITSTDTSPEVTLQNTTEEDTDGGRESKITFKGEQSGGEVSTLAQIQASHDGTADDEKGDLIFRTNDGSDGNTPTERMRIDSAGDVSIGTLATGLTSPLMVKSNSSDFSILLEENSGAESWQLGVDVDGDLNFHNSGSATPSVTFDDSGNVGIGTNSPANLLTVQGTSSGQNLLHLMNSAGSSDGDAENQLRVTCNGNTNWGNLDIQAYNTIFTQNNSEAMRIDSNGNVGIGTTNPLYPLYVDRGATGDIAHFEGQGSVHMRIGESSNNMYLNANNGSAVLAFQTNGTERMRVDSSGLGIGVSATYRLDVSSGGSAAAARLRRNTDGTLRSILLFLSSSNSNTVGSVSINNTSTSYNTSSDHRLKENVTNVTNGITRVKQLAPKRFNFIADADTTVDGFIAHEAQTVVPEAVTGTHNEVDADGNPVYQGIDQSKLVPLLTAALQEAITKIETLETEMTSVKARLDALESA